MCSRLVMGSAAMPARPSKLVTKPSISSRALSASVAQSRFGRCKEPRMFNGTPEVEPGV